MFRMRIYRVKGEVLVAVCDSDIAGKTFKEGNLKIEVREEFYGNKEVEMEDVKLALQQATIANITGKRAVKLAISIGIIDKEKVLKIGECWYAQMVLI